MAGVAAGLDFGAVLAIAAVQGADLELLGEVLPAFESALLAALAGEAAEDDHHGEDC